MRTGQSVGHYSKIRPATRIPSADCNCPYNPMWMTSARQSPRNLLAASLSATVVPGRASCVEDHRDLRVPSSIGTSSGSALSTVATGVAFPLNCPLRDSLGTAESLRSPRTSAGTPRKKRTVTWASAVAFCSSSVFAATRNATSVEQILQRCCRFALSSPWHSEWA